MFDYLQQTMRGVTSGDKAVFSFNSLDGVITAIANVFIIIGFGLSLLSLAYSFIQFASSGGDKDGLEKAKSNLTWSVVGMLLALFAFTVKNIILNIMGVK